VVEVGLGGRLDATNVLVPDVCAITSIGLDHTEMLGDTNAAIAREKAGICKPGVPVVLGAELDPSARAAVRAVADERGAPWRDAMQFGALRDVTTSANGATFVVTAEPWGALRLAIALRGLHQVYNARTALAVLGELATRGLAVPADAVRDGFAAARWPGRLEPCPREPRLWWDGAHNIGGFGSLVISWGRDLRHSPPGAFVFALSRDKPARPMLEVLRVWAPRATVHVTRTRNERAMPPDALLADATAAGVEATAHDSVAAACEAALASTDGRVLLAGSLFAVGEAMERFGGAPGEIE
jgi:dihydrofolate synthase/folylpolyglutamate synthase